MTYYEELDVAPNAGDREIKAAYHRMISAFHPDNYHGDADFAKDKLMRIEKAYSVLKDPEKRRAYDAEICMGRGQDNFTSSQADAGRRAGERNSHKTSSRGREDDLYEGDDLFNDAWSDLDWDEEDAEEAAGSRSRWDKEEPVRRTSEGTVRMGGQRRNSVGVRRRAEKDRTIRTAAISVIAAVCVALALIAVFFIGRNSALNPFARHADEQNAENRVTRQVIFFQQDPHQTPGAQ
jgi:DnaJ-class molecular chaperone